MAEKVLVLGATSGIAEAVCEVLAERGCELVLTARNMETLEALASRLREQHEAIVHVEHFDATALDDQAALMERCIAAADGGLDGVVLCHGHLPEEGAMLSNLDSVRQTIDINYVSAVWVLELVARHMEERKKGWVAVVTSVAGDRGRRKQYLYSSMKAGLTVYTAGLRARLHVSGVHVVTVKPGYVDTKMIAGRVDAPSWAIATPRRVAKDMDRAVRRRQNILYTPWFWRPIMFITRSVPEMIFKRMNV